MSKRTLRTIILAWVVGSVIGVGGYTFFYAKAASYISNNPAACANCHIMNEQYDGWVKGSHRNVATCNDCHTPHTFFGKYKTKLTNGIKHSYFFTMGTFPEPIQIAAHSREITEEACRYCHQEIVTAIDRVHTDKGELQCIRCHDSVGHMK